MHGLRRVVWLVLGCALALASTTCGGGNRPPDPPVPVWIDAYCEFTQLSFTLGHLDEGGVPQVDIESNLTPWGECRVSFAAEPGVYYLNLFYRNGTVQEWWLRDLPIVSRPTNGGAASQTVSVVLDLLSPPNWPVNSLWYAVTLSDIPVNQEPVDLKQAEVFPELVEWIAGEAEYEPMLADWPAPLPVGTGTSDVPAIGAHDLSSFPNQEQGYGECVPAAISNSLGYLNAVYGLGLTPAELDIDAMKGQIGWTPAGAPAGDDPWWEQKAANLADAPYSIRTTIRAEDGTEADRIAGFDEMIAALVAGKDVEVRIDGHAACVVAAAKLLVDGATRYVLHVSHDTDQGEEPDPEEDEGQPLDEIPGTKTEVAYYDPVTNRYAGGWLFDEVAHDRFVIEEPIP